MTQVLSESGPTAVSPLIDRKDETESVYAYVVVTTRAVSGVAGSDGASKGDYVTPPITSALPIAILVIQVEEDVVIGRALLARIALIGLTSAVESGAMLVLAVRPTVNRVAFAGTALIVAASYGDSLPVLREDRVGLSLADRLFNRIAEDKL